MNANINKASINLNINKININLEALNAIRGNPVPDVEPKQLQLYDAAEAEINDIQAVKNELAQGIISGNEPYPLLLKAVQAIATLTNDRVFYEICKETMNGGAMLTELPQGGEQEGIKKDLRQLEVVRRNIDTAIKAHRKQLENQPEEQEQGKNENNAKNEYKKRVKKCFGLAYKFICQNINPRSAKDWERIAGNLSQYKDPLAVGLVCECINEFERDYIENRV